MRNTWLIIRREYLEKVRTKGFVISTLAMPLLIGVFLLPGRLMTMKTGGRHKLVVVTNDAGLGAQVQEQLQRPPQQSTSTDEASAREIVGKYVVELSSDLSGAERDRLNARLASKDIDGYLWAGPEQLASRRITYVQRETSNFLDQSAVRSALSDALVAQALDKRGVPESERQDLLKSVKLDIVQNQNGKEAKVNTGAAIGASIAMGLLLYVCVLFYGVAIMRSVIEEKSSRIMEVLLSSVTPKELLAGKIIGVAAVGLTQVLIWVSIVVLAVLQGGAGAGMFEKAHLSLPVVILFPVFFLLGYALYGTMYAALGAVVNTEQEGQQMQMIIMMPLILAIAMAMPVIQSPNGALATWGSFIPFAAPIVMYMRVVVQTPPAWQIALCIGLMLATIYALLALCSRIYRIGILMYGKRPTLPEIVKWLRYAGA